MGEGRREEDRAHILEGDQLAELRDGLRPGWELEERFVVERGRRRRCSWRQHVFGSKWWFEAKRR